MEGRRFLITSGPTRGYIDAVRYITNSSTGALGSFIGAEVLRRGAEVTFFFGKGSLIPDLHGLSEAERARLLHVEIETVEDLTVGLKSELAEKLYDVVIHSIAVLDYVPEETVNEKVASGMAEWAIKLVKTPKVIGMIREIDPQVLLVGFKLEVDMEREELVERAYQSLCKYGADLFVANDLSRIKKGEHIGYIVDPQGEVIAQATGKQEIAKSLAGIIEKEIAARQKGGSHA